MNFHALKLEKSEEIGLFGRTRIVSGKNPGGGAFGAGFRDGALALQIKIVEKLLAVGGEIVHAEENGALLHVDIVAGGPFHSRERRIGAIPLATGVGRTKQADAGIGAAIAESFVEATDGVVIVSDGEKIVGSPSVVKAVSPDANDAALGHLFNFVIGHLLPFADDDGIEPGIVRTGTGHDVKIGDGFVEIVHDGGMPVEVGLEHVAGKSEADAEVVAIIVVRNVVAPPNKRIGRLVGMFFVLHVNVNHAVVAVHFDDGSDEHNGIAADFLDEGRVFDGKTVSEFHKHFRSAGFRGVDAAVGPVDGLAFGNELLRFGIAQATGIGEAGGDFLIAIEFREIGFVGDGSNEHLAAFFGVTNAPDFDAGALIRQQAEIGVDVLGVIENIGSAHDVMKEGIGSGNARAERKMVDEFGAEKRFGGEFFDLFGVLGVVGKRARTGLGRASGCEETERYTNSEQAANHIAPQGKTIVEDYIGYSAQGRNRVVDDARAIGL